MPAGDTIIRQFKARHKEISAKMTFEVILWKREGRKAV